MLGLVQTHEKERLQQDATLLSPALATLVLTSPYCLIASAGTFVAQALYSLHAHLLHSLSFTTGPPLSRREQRQIAQVSLRDRLLAPAFSSSSGSSVGTSFLTSSTTSALAFTAESSGPVMSDFLDLASGVNFSFCK